MFSLNRIDIIGYQTQPVTLRQTPGGTSVTDLNLVVPYTFKVEKGQTLSGKSFFTVTVWGAMADVAGQFVRQGTQLFISGRLQTDSWEDTGTHEKRYKTKVVSLEMIILDPKAGQTPAPASKELAVCLNRAQVIGNLTRDPELRTTTSGQHVLSFSVATNERWKDKTSGEVKERSEFHNVVVWGDLAVKVQQHMKKGQRTFVSGRLQTRSFETQAGVKKYTTEIVADQVSMLGIKNEEAFASFKADGVVTSDGAPSDKHSEPVPAMTAASIPDVKYESEIKPEDLPF